MSRDCPMNLRWLLPIVCCVACGSPDPLQDISRDIESQLNRSQTEAISLQAVGPADWESVCVLEPYTNNQRAEEILGFEWDAESETEIYSRDGINVLVFVRGDDVVAFTEHPRDKGDFVGIEPKCFSRQQAVFTRQVDPNGWVYLRFENGS